MEDPTKYALLEGSLYS